MREDMKGFVSMILILLLSAALGCGPSLGRTIALPEVPAGGAAAVRPVTAGTLLFIDEVKDVRAENALVGYAGKNINADREVSPVVREALEKAFKGRGFTISDSAPIIVTGEVKNWFANVRGGLPGSVDSNASIQIDVFDPANKRIFSGNYQGSAALETPSVDERDIRGALGTAMSEAISQILADQQLIELLASF